jgi:SAM-dependent methyltransferase
LGLATGQAEFLIQAQRTGVRFEKTLTIGRQNFLVSPWQLERLFRRHAAWPATLRVSEMREALVGASGFADPFFRMLGARTVDALDVSEFEGATIIHDLNYAISSALHQAFDVVIDGGSLEHVFNFPVALQSCMEMVKVGGHFIVVTPANNNCGHGFYQFSPELFFRALSPDNGFLVERMIAFENDVEVAHLFHRSYLMEIAGPWFQVADPAVIGDRVLLMNRRPVLLMIQARRLSDVPVLARYPQQSDYAATWKAHEQNPSAFERSQAQKRWVDRVIGRSAMLHLKLHAIGSVMRWIAPLQAYRLYRRRQFANRRSFRPAPEVAVAPK